MSYFLKSIVVYLFLFQLTNLIQSELQYIQNGENKNKQKNKKQKQKSDSQGEAKHKNIKGFTNRNSFNYFLIVGMKDSFDI